jgi:hypothetical protein
MKKLFSLAAIVLLAQVGRAAVNFDQGVDVKSTLDTAKTSDASVPNIKLGMSTPQDITRDCKQITFGPNDPLTSAIVPLKSQETDQDCENMGYPAGQICTPSFHTYTANAQIVITQPRVLQPGQKEVFEVCLWGQFLDMKPVSSVYKYSVNEVLDVFQLTPQVPAKAEVAAVRSEGATCPLVMDTDYSCVYQCKDGYHSNPNPFGPSSMPGMSIPFHGCNPSISDTPLITILTAAPLKYNQQNKALAKIKLDAAQDAGTLLAAIQPDMNVGEVVSELSAAGFKAQAVSDGHGYFLISVDASGTDAADSALGLAKYYYVTSVSVGKPVYNALFSTK